MQRLGKKHILYKGQHITEIVTRPVTRTGKGDFTILHTDYKRCYLTPVNPPQVINGYELSYEYSPPPTILID